MTVNPLNMEGYEAKAEAPPSRTSEMRRRWWHRAIRGHPVTI